MRSHATRAEAARAGRSGSARGRGLALVHRLGWSAKDAAGFMIGAFATIAIVINMLFLQSGVHPAPMFKASLAPAGPVAANGGATAVVTKATLAPVPPTALPRVRPAEPSSGKLAPPPPAEPSPPPKAQSSTAPALPAPTPKVVSPSAPPPMKAASPSAPRTPGEIITDIQRELARRGFYDGTVDGLYGPKTDAAIREFEQTAGLKASVEPTEALLAAMTRAPARFAKVASASAPSARPAPVRSEPAAERPAPSSRVLAFQRALADYGYGQIKPSGILDGETQKAIEKFERERKLPVTGQVSDRLARELTAMTGRPLE